MKKYVNFVLISIFCFICFFISKVYALTTLANQTFPDFPNKQYTNIIVERINNQGYFLIENNNKVNFYLNDGKITSNNSTSFKVYSLTDNIWVLSGSYTSCGYENIIATTIDIYSDSSFTSKSFEHGFNLLDTSPFVMNFTDTTGYEKNGFYFNQSSIDYIWNELFEGKSFIYYYGFNYNLIPEIYSNSIYSKIWKKEDFPNLACKYTNSSYFECVFLEALDSMNFSKNSNTQFSYNTSLNNYGSYPKFTFTTSTGKIVPVRTVSPGVTYSHTNRSSWVSNFDVINRDTGVLYKEKLFDYSNDLFLPDYLQGYKKIDLTTNDKYVMISHVQSGSVYIPKSSFDTYGGLLSYYDNELSSQTYDSYIQDYTVMEDEQFVRQDFDLSNYYGADWVMFSKYLYLEGEDNVSYSIWVPDDSYDSQVTITPNNHGGNDFDYEYMDENGVVQNGQVSSVDLSQYSLEFNSKEGSIYKAKSLLVSLKDMNYIWNSSFDIFYNNLPELVQLLLIFFFNIIMILICLKLVGWKE